VALSDGKLWVADGASLSSLRLDSVVSDAESIALKGERQVFTPDGRFLLSVDGSTAIARNLATGVTTSLEFSDVMAFDKRLDSVLISPDSRYVGLIGTARQPDGTIASKFRGWKLDPTSAIGTGLVVYGIRGGALSADGKFLAQMESGPIPSASVLDTATGEVVGSVRDKEDAGPGGRIWSAASFSHDNTLVALNAGDGAVRIFTLAPWKEIFRIGLGAKATQFAWSHDDQTLAVGTNAGFITVWGVSSREDISRISARAFAYSPSGRYSVVKLDESRSVLRDSNNHALQPFDGDGFSNYAFSGDERRFASIDQEQGGLPFTRFPRTSSFAQSIIRAST
jgi:WD40 repeat protein